MKTKTYLTYREIETGLKALLEAYETNNLPCPTDDRMKTVEIAALKTTIWLVENCAQVQEDYKEE